MMSISRSLLLLVFVGPALAAEGDLVIVEKGKTTAQIVVSPKAGKWEKQAATDLAHFINLMSGAKPTIADTEQATATALKSSGWPGCCWNG